MNILNLVLAFLLLSISACSLTETIGHKSSDNHSRDNDFANTEAPNPISLAEGEALFWVDSLRADCVGVAPMSCLQVQEGEAIKQEGWQLFYSSIDGFSYEAGYIYKLLVRKEHLPLKQVPADGSSINYTLVRVLQKTFDAKLRLNDIWALEKMQGESIILDQAMQRPQLEIHLRDMKIIGNDGCNHFSGAIRSLDMGTIVFGPVASTRRFCQGMEVSNQFNDLMSRIQSYVIKDLNLYLSDEQGKELLSFRKID